MNRRWEICVAPEMEDVIVEADGIFYSQETGWLAFQKVGFKGNIAAFAPGKWSYFREITDEPR